MIWERCCASVLWCRITFHSSFGFHIILGLNWWDWQALWFLAWSPLPLPAVRFCHQHQPDVLPPARSTAFSSCSPNTACSAALNQHRNTGVEGNMVQWQAPLKPFQGRPLALKGEGSGHSLLPSNRLLWSSWRRGREDPELKAVTAPPTKQVHLKQLSVNCHASHLLWGW